MPHHQIAFFYPEYSGGRLHHGGYNRYPRISIYTDQWIMPRPKAIIEGKHPGGQPTKYRKEYPKIAKEAIRSAGFSIAKVAKLFGVHRDTIYAWMERHKEFSDGIRAGRNAYDGLCIEQSLVKRARGYRYTEVTQKNIDGKMQTVQKITKHIPPDVAAIKHWQTNRDPKSWRDKHGIEIEGLDTLAERLSRAHRRADNDDKQSK